jgi:WD40 repeat protein
MPEPYFHQLPKMHCFFDAFISYGRADSKIFATKLYEKLTLQGLNIWFDQSSIPLGVDFQNQINDGIEKADNFIFIIAPHSVKSPYCLKEIQLAVKCNKRIIPLLHVMPQTQEVWDKMHPAIGKINWIYFQEGIDDFESSFSGLINLIHKNSDYVKWHTHFLVKSLEWERNHKQTNYLLIGEERQQAESWLKVRFKDEQPPCEPTDLHCEFIGESTKNANNLMTQVFISHSERDRRFRDKLCITLRRQGFTIWTNKTDIKTGTEFQDEINKGLEGADNFIFLLSPDSLRSPYCSQEIDHAFANNKRLIFLLIEPTELSQIPLKLRILQFIDFTQHEEEEQYRISADKLINELRQDAYYYEQHKILLVKALKWLRQNRNPSILLRGYNLRHAEAWLNVAKQRTEHSPLPLHTEFITESAKKSTDSSLEVFISYSRADSDFARKLNEALQLQGKTTWFDQESIASGYDFQQEIYRGIESSDNFLFIISPKSVNSPYCADEVEYAQKLNKRFVTVLHKAVPGKDLHPGLRCIQWIDFNQHNGDFYANFSELVRTLDTDREHVHNHTKWSQRALEWEQKGKSADLLLRGSEFLLARNWLQETEQNNKQPPTTDLQKAFIEASKHAIEAAEEAEKCRQAEMLRLQEERTQEAEARLAEQKKSAQRQKLFLAAVSAALVVSTVLGVAAFFGYRKAAISEVKAIAISSEALFTSNKILDSLIEAIRAKRQLQQLGGIDANMKLRVDRALQQAVYGVREYNRFSGHSGAVWGVSFSPDGQVIASASGDSTIKLWKKDGTLLTTIKGHTAAVYQVAFSSDSQLIASASGDSTAKLWKKDGTLLTTFKGHSAGVNGVAFSPNGQILASASDDSTVKIWKKDGTLLTTLKGHNAIVYGVSFSPDGQMLASAGEDNVVKLWNKDGTLLTTLKGHSAKILQVSFSPDSQIIASASGDKTVKLWKKDGTLLTTLTEHNDVVRGVDFSPDGQTLASASDDKTIKLWKRDGTFLRTLKGHSAAVMGVDFSPDGQTLASASENTVRLWKRDNTMQMGTYQYKTAVYEVSFSPDGQMLASGSGDNTVKLWKRDGTLLTTLKGHSAEVIKIAFSPDGQRFASAGWDNTIKLWKRDGTLLTTLKGHSATVYGLAFSPDGQILASASGDNTIKLWKKDGTLLTTFKGHNAMVFAVAFSPDSQILASSSGDNTIKLWKKDGTRLRTLYGHSAGVYGVVFSPDGQTLASGSTDNTIKLWSRDGTLLTTLYGHSAAIWAISFSPDGQILASTSEDSTVKLWKKDGTLIRTLYGHSAEVWGVSFSPDGQMLASASEDKTIILWNVERVLALDPLVYGCDWVRDYLKNNSLVEKNDSLRDSFASRTLCDSITPQK